VPGDTHELRKLLNRFRPGLLSRLLPTDWGELIPEPLGSAVLGPRLQTTIALAADALFPKGELFPLSGAEAGMGAYFDRYLERSQPVERLLIRLLLVFTELSPMLFGPRPLPFSRLRPDQRTAFLREAAQSRIYLRRVAFTSLRALMTMGYLASPLIAQRIGIAFNPDPFDRGTPCQAEGTV
jgi:hypothetical protein